VVDLAQGHLAALNTLRKSSGLLKVNLGTGQGYSVLEMIEAFKQASGKPIPYDIVSRRPGDIAACYASPVLAKEMLGWEATHTLQDMVASSWKWQLQNPDGYN
jgi:UDP-glucose 4-epimerase